MYIKEKKIVKNAVLDAIDLSQMTDEEKERLDFYNDGIKDTKRKLSDSIIRCLSLNKKLTNDNKTHIRKNVGLFTEFLFRMSIAEKCAFKTYEANMLVSDFIKKQDASIHRLAVLRAKDMGDNKFLIHTIAKKIMPEKANANPDEIDTKMLEDKINQTIKTNINSYTKEILKRYTQKSDCMEYGEHIIENDIHKLLKFYTNSKVQSEYMKETFKEYYGFGGYLMLSFERELMEFVNGKTSIISRQPRKINTCVPKVKTFVDKTIVGGKIVDAPDNKNKTANKNDDPCM